MEDLLTINEAAEILKLNPETLRQRIRKDEMPGFFKIGKRDWRIKREDLLNWIDQKKQSQSKESE